VRPIRILTNKSESVASIINLVKFVIFTLHWVGIVFVSPIPLIFTRTLCLGTSSCNFLICRKHFLQCEQGLLTKHFEKLIQCSLRLDLLSKQPEIILDSPYFDTQFTAFEKPDNLKDCDLHQVNGKGSATTRFQSTGSPHSSSLSPSFTIENSDPSAITLDSVPCEAPSSSSGTIRTCL
jgi:hypothetical protein